MVKYWCESCLCFVESSHRCEAWPTVTAISRDIIDAICAEARAEALREAADRATAYLENAGSYYVAVSSRTIGQIRAAITQEPQP